MVNKQNKIYFFSFLFGLTSLSLEVCWQRLLVLTFGSTSIATTAIIASFLGGMALGSFFLTLFFQKRKFPLFLILGVVEIILGLYIFIFPYLLKIENNIYPQLFNLAKDNYFLFNTGKFCLIFLVLSLPAILIGASFPLLCNKPDSKFSIIYGVNTFGGVMGSFLTGFFFIKYFGIQGTNNLIGAISLLFGICLLGINTDEEKEVCSMEINARSSETPLNLLRFFPFFFFFSGFLSLGLEIVFIRILVFFVANHSYSFTIILTAFLGGIGGGSLLINKLLIKNKLKKDYLWLGIIQVFLGMMLIFLIPLTKHLYVFNRIFPSTSWLGMFAGRYSVSLALIFLPALFMGMILPLAASIFIRNQEKIYLKIGKLYAWNNLGSVSGVIIAGFIFIPFFGVYKTIIVFAFLYLLGGAISIYFQSGLSFKEKILSYSFPVVVFVFGLLIFFSPLPPLSLSAQVYDARPKQDKLLYYQEGLESAVTVVEDVSGIRKLHVDSHQAANESRWDAPSHKIIGHLPVFLHPDPKKALIIGFGMGLTSRAIILNNVSVDAVEISKEVIEANHFFSRINEQITDHPLLNISIADGRNYVRITEKKYDLISIGIIHPMINAGSAGFYSRDFYEECKKILNKDGVVSQWVPLHSVPPESLRMIVRTFNNSFPHTSLWYKFTSDFFILIATPEKLKIDFNSFSERMKQPQVSLDLKDVDMESPVALLDSFMMGTEELNQYAGDGSLHTDNFPYLEFFSPADKIDTAYYNLKAIQSYRKNILPYLENVGEADRTLINRAYQATDHTIIGQLYYLRNDFRNAVKQFQVGLDINPDDNNLRFLRDELRYNLKITGG